MPIPITFVPRPTLGRIVLCPMIENFILFGIYKKKNYENIFNTGTLQENGELLGALYFIKNY